MVPFNQKTPKSTPSRQCDSLKPGSPKKGRAVPPAIFREYDIRGVVDKEITEELACQIGIAFGLFLRKRGLKSTAIGHDCRLSSSALATACTDGLRQTGIHVTALGLVPTPLVYFAMHQNPALSACISVTGSHNPAEYNGFKLAAAEQTLSAVEIQQLYTSIVSGETKSSAVKAKGSLQHWDPQPAYIEKVSSDIKLAHPMKIIIDAGNGAASELAPQLFGILGCEVSPLFCEFDGRFPNHFPDPTLTENLAALQTTLIRQKAGIGLAFDGDADRLGVVDPSGKIVPGDLLLCLFARDLLQKHPGAKILGDVKCSNLLFSDVAKRGGKALMWKTGHSLIKAKLKAEGALLAGEMSGHFFFSDRYFGYDDALYAGARLVEILSRLDASPAELLADLPRTFATPEIRIDCKDEEKFLLISAVRERLSKKYQADLIDGIRLSFGETDWALIRASNTQPVIVMRFEAETEERLTALRAIVEEAAAEALREIGNANR